MGVKKKDAAKRKVRGRREEGNDGGRWKITMRAGDGEMEFWSTATASRKQSACNAAREKPGTPPQPRVTAPLILLTLLVFHPHRLAGSIHTSITLQSLCFPLPYAKGSGEQWRVSGGWMDGWMDK